MEYFKSQVVVAEDVLNDTSSQRQFRKWDNFNKSMIIDDNQYKYLIYEIKQMRKNKQMLDPQGLTPSTGLSRIVGKKTQQQEEKKVEEEQPQKKQEPYRPVNTFSVHKLNEGTGPVCPKGA